MNKKIGKKVRMIALTAFLWAGFLLYLFLAPYQLDVKMKQDVVYLDEPVSVRDFMVYLKSLCGIRFPVHDFYYKQDMDRLSVRAKHLRYKKELNCEAPVDHKIVYDTKVYAGQAIDPDKLHIISVYPDTERETRSFTVAEGLVPLSDKSICQIAVHSGVIEWTMDVVKPEKIKAKYKKAAKLGDLFDKSQVVVKLVYPDQTDAKIKDFVISEPPAYLTGRLNVDIETDYGNTSLVIEPQNLQALTVSYPDTVYVGDMLDDSKFALSMLDENGDPVPITDFEVENPGEIKTLTHVTVHSKYGDAVLTVDPVRVEGCMGDADGELIEGQTPKFKVLHLYYADGQVRDLGPDDVEFTNLDSIQKAGKNTIYFIYHGVYYWFEQDLLPEKIVQARKSGNDILEDGTKYTLNQDQIQALAVITQRIAVDDLDIASAELSLMANRYELYGGDQSDEGAYLLKYILESGYWGNDLGDQINNNTPSEDFCYLVQDVLGNGHRFLPQYIDEHISLNEIKEMNSSDFEKDQTEITKPDDIVFRFYDLIVPDMQVAYGYTDVSYETVKHAKIPVSDPKTKVMHLEDDDGIIIEMDEDDRDRYPVTDLESGFVESDDLE